MSTQDPLRPPRPLDGDWLFSDPMNVLDGTVHEESAAEGDAADGGMVPAIPSRAAPSPGCRKRRDPDAPRVRAAATVLAALIVLLAFLLDGAVLVNRGRLAGGTPATAAGAVHRLDCPTPAGNTRGPASDPSKPI